VLRTSIYDTDTSSQMFMPFNGASFINDCMPQSMLHVNHPLLQFADITDPLLILLHYFPDIIVAGFIFGLLRWPRSL